MLGDGDDRGLLDYHGAWPVPPANPMELGSAIAARMPREKMKRTKEKGQWSMQIW
jgi:hypothetical protein